MVMGGPVTGYLWFASMAIASNDFQVAELCISAEEIFVSDGSKWRSSNIRSTLSARASASAVTDARSIRCMSTACDGRPTGEADEERGVTPGSPICRSPRRRSARPCGGPVNLDLSLFPQQSTGEWPSREQLLTAGVRLRRGQPGAGSCSMPALEPSSVTRNCRIRSYRSREPKRMCHRVPLPFRRTPASTGTPRRAPRWCHGALNGGWRRMGKEVDCGALEPAQSTKFNWVSYIVAAGAEACTSSEGQAR